MFRLTGSALDESDWPMMRADVAPHDHAVFVYDQEPDLLEPLEAFLHGGIKSREMTTFVHSFARHEKAQAFLARRVPDVARHEQEKDLTLAAYRARDLARPDVLARVLATHGYRFGMRSRHP